MLSSSDSLDDAIDVPASRAPSPPPPHRQTRRHKLSRVKHRHKHSMTLNTVSLPSDAPRRVKPMSYSLDLSVDLLKGHELFGSSTDSIDTDSQSDEASWSSRSAADSGGQTESSDLADDSSYDKPSDEDRMIKLKLEGNKLFEQGEYEKAIDRFTEALKIEETAVLYSNRALCYLRLNRPKDALNDTRKALYLDAYYTKAHFHQSTALFALGRYEEGIESLMIAAKTMDNPKVKKLFRICKRNLQKQRFLREMNIGDKNTSRDSGTRERESSNEIRCPRIDVRDGKKIITRTYINDLIDYYRVGKSHDFSHSDVRLILKTAAKIMKKTDNIESVDFQDEKKECIVVAGDLHGRFDCFARILKPYREKLSRTIFVFNGDFTDRGKCSVEILLVLLCLKIRFPRSVFLNRGNHETKTQNYLYGTYEEITTKLGEEFIPRFRKVFYTLNLGVVLCDRYFVVHGGIPIKEHDIKSLNERIDRFRDVDVMSGDDPMTEMLWNDPGDFKKGFKKSPRGIGYLFGESVVDSFLKLNGLKCIIRSHEAKREGYEIQFNGKLATIFSVARYLGNKNRGAYIVITRDFETEVVQFG